MRKMYPQRRATNGRATSIFLTNDEGKGGVRLGINIGGTRYLHIGLSIPQAAAAIEVLSMALRDAEIARAEPEGSAHDR